MKKIISGLLVVSCAFAGNLIDELKKPVNVEKIHEIGTGGEQAKFLFDKPFEKRKSLKIEKIKTNPFPSYDRFKHTVSLTGHVRLYDAFSLLMNEGVKVITQGQIENKDLILAVKTKSISDFINKVCQSADLWCNYDQIGKVLKVEKDRMFTVDFTPEGKIVFSIGSQGTGGETEGGEGEGGQTGEGTQGGTSSGQSLTYAKENLSGDEAIDLFEKMFGVKVYPSAEGFLMFSATPSQWERIRRYFEEREKRREIVYAEIQLLRIDLKDQFKWGINWSGITKASLFKGIKTIGFGVNSGLITEGDQATVSLLTKAGEEKALITALSQYGKVHKVDSWYYQMVTGTPVPFRNYQLVRYFTMGAVQNNNTTETTVEVNEDEVGFRGVLSLYKEKNGYYVDGFIDLSAITDFLVLRTTDGELKAPQIEGKSFRIMTKLPSLNRTLVIGGFRVKGFSSTDTGTPVLSRIPILGYLFKGKENLKENSEFVVLITLKPAKYGKSQKIEDAEKVINKGIKGM